MTNSWRFSTLGDRHRALGSNLEDWSGMGTAWSYDGALQFSRFRWDYGEAVGAAGPQVVVRDPSGLVAAVVGNPGFVFDNLEETWQTTHSLQRTFGAHTLRVGADVIVSDFALLGGGNPDGNFTVDLTAGQLASLSSRGLALSAQDVLALNPAVANYAVELRPQSFGHDFNVTRAGHQRLPRSRAMPVQHPPINAIVRGEHPVALRVMRAQQRPLAVGIDQRNQRNGCAAQVRGELGEVVEFFLRGGVEYVVAQERGQALGVLFDHFKKLVVPGHVVEAAALAVHLVRQATGGDDGHAQVFRVALDGAAQRLAQLVAAACGRHRELQHPDLQRDDGQRPAMLGVRQQHRQR